MSPLLAFLSLLAELGLGYPDRLFRAIGHPVTWLGRLIAFADRRLNRATDSDLQRRTAGVVALVLFVAVPAAASLILETVLSGLPFGLLLSALAASPLLAQRSLGQHVQAVADALETGGLAEGRKAVSMIVGRDPERLDEAGVCRAAIESLAENFSDGIVAPAFWLGVGGLAGGAAYKAVNTADSMIGHRTTPPTRRSAGLGALRTTWSTCRPSGLSCADNRRRQAIADARRGRRQRLARGAARSRKASARQCRLARKRPWPARGHALAGPARLWRCEGGRRLHGGRRPPRPTAADIRRALRLLLTEDLLPSPC